ncbi:hypothetical protein [Luteimonas aquatica]|uniref:hypothetical protein n=1 Tax=Luteimonas aquatica TaxID=450364 RepID=UPI001F56AAF9|nr:hypothetical protein [Luteimonas aquatica]
MRGTLFLLIGFAAAVALGVWWMDASTLQAGKQVAAGTEYAPPLDHATLWAFTAAAWLSAFAVRTPWLYAAHTILFVLLGLALIGLGLAGAWLDAGFRPWERSQGPALIGFGAAILASRALMMVLIVQRP